MIVYPELPIPLCFPSLLPPSRTRCFITFLSLDAVETGKKGKKWRSWLVHIVNTHGFCVIFSPSLFRSLRPRELIEERVPWLCAGRQGSMPTRRKRTMNNKLPSTQEASLVLGVTKEPRNQHIKAF